MPPRKVHELTFLWFGLPGPLLTSGGSNKKSWEPPSQAQRSPGPFGPEPQKSPKRVRKGVPLRGAQSPQKVRHGVRKESKNAALDFFGTLFGLCGALFGDSGAPRGGGHPFGLFSDSFGVPGPKGPGDLCVSECQQISVPLHNGFLHGLELGLRHSYLT